LATPPDRLCPSSPSPKQVCYSLNMLAGSPLGGGGCDMYAYRRGVGEVQTAMRSGAKRNSRRLFMEPAAVNKQSRLGG